MSSVLPKKMPDQPLILQGKQTDHFASLRRGGACRTDRSSRRHDGELAVRPERPRFPGPQPISGSEGSRPFGALRSLARPSSIPSFDRLASLSSDVLLAEQQNERPEEDLRWDFCYETSVDKRDYIIWAFSLIICCSVAWLVLRPQPGTFEIEVRQDVVYRLDTSSGEVCVFAARAPAQWHCLPSE